MSLTAEQIELRRTGIGSSDIAAILGVSPFRTAFDVYLEKVEGFQSEKNFSMELGDLLEPVVLELYRRREDPKLLELPGTLVHPDNPLLLTTPDALAIFDTFDPGSFRVVEVKAPRYRSDDWGDEGSDGIEEAYILQAQWHMYVLRARGHGITRCDVPVLFGASEYRCYRVDWDPELAGMLVDEGLKFWRDHIEKRVPPDIDGSRFAPEWLKARFPKNTAPLIEGTPEDDKAAGDLRMAQAAMDVAEMHFDAHKSRWKQRIGEAAGVVTKLGTVSWTTDKNGKRTFRTPKEWRRDNGNE